MKAANGFPPCGDRFVSADIGELQHAVTEHGCQVNNRAQILDMHMSLAQLETLDERKLGDVRTEGGKGGSRIAQFCGRIRLIGCVKCGQGEGGSKIPKILWTSYVHGPLAISFLATLVPKTFIQYWVRVNGATSFALPPSRPLLHGPQASLAPSSSQERLSSRK